MKHTPPLLTLLRLLFRVAYAKHWLNWKPTNPPHTHTHRFRRRQAVAKYLEEVAAQYENGLPTFEVQKSAFVMPRRLNQRVELEVRKAI